MECNSGPLGVAGNSWRSGDLEELVFYVLKIGTIGPLKIND
jgi:hypothetical protein